MRISSLLMAIGAVLIATLAQVLLKKAASCKGASFLKKFFNPRVLFAYFLMFLSTFINLFAFRHLDLRYAPAIGATGFVMVFFLSFLCFGEKPTVRKLLGTSLIIAGVLISVLL